MEVGMRPIYSLDYTKADWLTCLLSNDEYMNFIFQPRSEKMNEEKILAVKEETYPVAKRKPERIQRKVRFRTLNSAIPLQSFNQ